MMKRLKTYLLFLLLLSTFFILCGCSNESSTDVSEVVSNEPTEPIQTETQQPEPVTTVESTGIPAYSGNPYIELNNNQAGFSAEEITTQSFENYSELDSLGRVGIATACLGPETLPTEERGSISEVKPTGWKQNYYDCVDGEALYNRCHMIAYSLSGENANEKNLMTGTRYFNVEGMLNFEIQVADYIEATNNHVMYRITPYFTGDNLLADGVQMEAYSVEDEGRGVNFNVYCYNVEPGVIINYQDGSNQLDPAQNQSIQETPEVAQATQYVLNTRSKKYHLPSCPGVEKMSQKNRKDYTGTQEDLENQGYTPCGQCIIK